jgi:hypothetical protein
MHDGMSHDMEVNTPVTRRPINPNFLTFDLITMTPIIKFPSHPNACSYK